MNKPKRIKNKKLIDSFRGLPCAVCASTNSTVGHHIKSVGSGGDDLPENLLPLCAIHHREIHDIGRDTFFKKYKNILKVRSY